MFPLARGRFRDVWILLLPCELLPSKPTVTPQASLQCPTHLIPLRTLTHAKSPTPFRYKMTGGWQYRASKAALNMLNACMKVEYAESGIKVLAFDPGFTVSGLSEHNTRERGAREVGESVRPLVELIEGSRDGDDGLLHNDGSYGW